MATVTDAPVYARRFVGGIARTIHIVALRLAALDGHALIPVNLRKQALHILNFAFEVESACPSCAISCCTWPRAWIRLVTAMIGCPRWNRGFKLSTVMGM